MFERGAGTPSDFQAHLIARTARDTDLHEQTVGQFSQHEPADDHAASAGGAGDASSPRESLRTFERADTRVFGAMTTPQALVLLTDEQLAGVVGGGGKGGISGDTWN